MDVDGTDQLVGSTTSINVAKGKRTKRHRPFSASVTHSTSSSASADDNLSFNSSASATLDATEEEEEEDMANCLILLAQSGDAPHKQPPTTKNISGFYVYECRTCNKSFPSFQALGGHRASHKKPKVEPPQAPAAQVAGFEFEEGGEDQFKGSSQVSLQLATNKAKIHECSICGSEFTSGQALGGHMRRHRAPANTAAAGLKQRNVLELDLNLPAPEDDLRDSKFQFTAAQKSLVLSASALVDCHY
ncbi:zinc finger protein ZAT5 [Prosopis cineraria]|uniref:zinc finger protein ZAT5 n=1 Tax=Prosopis cineraria TaxID=364024 RepID=UPI00240F2909|nr:zinc finger protein ZAT5 [Prosopis cineraria]